MKIFVVLALAALSLSGCGVEEEDPGALNDSDLEDLRIEAVDATSVRIYSLSEVVTAGTALHVENMTQGPEGDVVAGDDGKFDVTVAGGVDHVFSVRSAGAKVMPIVREESGSVVRGYGVGFASATGCELQGWSGIIRDAAGDPRTQCSAGAAITPEGESLDGEVEPFVLRRETKLTVTAALVGVANEPPRFEIDFIDDIDESFTVPVLAQGTPGQFSATLLQVGQVSPDLPGRTVARLELRAPAGSSFVLADLTFANVAAPEE